jgi:spermidine synthase
VLRGDARELLAVLRTDYDVIFSEPSNPYRAGIASMYAREFYEAVQKRMRPNGLFVQWLQAYDVDASSVRTIYTTLSEVFPHIETWNGLKEDLLLVASREERKLDVPALRARLAGEPFATAQRLAWYEQGVTGFLSHFVADAAFARAAARSGAPVNTDDRSPVEFGFARSARGGTRFTSSSLFAAVVASGSARAPLQGEDVDWARVDYQRESFALAMGSATSPERLTPDYKSRFAMLSKWVNGDFAGALALWSLFGPREEPAHWTALERLMRAELLAYEGSVESERVISELLADRPTEAAFMRAVYALRHGRRKPGTALLRDALARHRGDPWPHPLPITRALTNLQLEQAGDDQLALQWLDALAAPFALRVNESARDRARLRLVLALGPEQRACVRVFESFEPYPPWTETMLKLRADCYDNAKHALRDKAAEDLASFRARAPVPFEVVLSR